MMNMNMTKPANASAINNGQPTITEYSIRAPKNHKYRHHIMRFNYNLNVDFSKWRNGSVKLERENNMREYKAYDEDAPKFGAGSEYKREEKEEARRKKFGIIAKKYDPERQPWLLKVGSSKSGKKFRGIREGGVSENAAHFIFTQTKDGSIEAFPLHEWYNFQPIQRYNTLTSEEAEEEFGRRRKCVNLWTMKMRMKLRNKEDEEPEFDPEETKEMKSKKSGDKKKLQISEMDEWMDSDDMSSESDDEEKKNEEEDDSDIESKKKKGKKKLQDKKKKVVNDEAFEESDDGDEEGREREYISDSSESSDSEPETKANKELKSVAEEDALRKLLTSDEDSDEEKPKEDQQESEEERKKEDMPNVAESKSEKSKEKKKDVDKKTKLQKVHDAINSSGPKSGNKSDFSSDSDDSDAGEKSKKKLKVEKHSSRSGTPVDATPAASHKRKVETNTLENTNSPQSTPAKKIKTETPSMPTTSFSSFATSSSNREGFAQTEAAVRRYLMRKPMTTTELLKKIQSKRTGVSSDELVEMMTAILKKINPTKQRIQGKMYLSLKATT